MVYAFFFLLGFICYYKERLEKYLREKEKQQKKQELLLEAQDILNKINEVMKR